MTITTINNSFHAFQQYISSYNTSENRDLAIKVTVAVATLGVATLLIRAYNKRDSNEFISRSQAPSNTGSSFGSTASNGNNDNSPAPGKKEEVASSLFINQEVGVVAMTSSNGNNENSPAPRKKEEVALRLFPNQPMSTSVSSNIRDSNGRSITPSPSPYNYDPLIRAIEEVLTPENKNRSIDREAKGEQS